VVEVGGRGEEAGEAAEEEEEVAERGLAGESTDGEDGREEVDCSRDGRLEREADCGWELEAADGLLAALTAVLDLSFLLLAGLLLCCCPLSAKRAVPASFRTALAAYIRGSTYSSSRRVSA